MNDQLKETETISQPAAQEPSRPEYPGITQEMVNNAKEKYGADKVKYADLPLDDNNERFLTVLITVPGRTVIGEFEKWSDKNPNKAKEIIINSCLLSHKDQVKADDNLFFTAVNAIADLIPIRKAIIKNL